MDIALLKTQLNVAKLHLDAAKDQMIKDDFSLQESRKNFYRLEGKVALLTELVRALLVEKENHVQKCG